MPHVRWKHQPTAGEASVVHHGVRSIRRSNGRSVPAGRDGGHVEPMPETREALAEFVTLDDPDVDELLADLGRSAQAIVPDLVGLSLGLAHEGLTFTLLASSSGVASIDAAQYVDGGPCVEVTEGRLDSAEVDTTDPMDEEQWRLFSLVSAASGVASSLSLPIYRDEHAGRRGEPLRLDPGRVRRPARAAGRRSGRPGNRGGDQCRPLLLHPPGRRGCPPADAGPHRDRDRDGAAGRTIRL